MISRCFGEKVLPAITNPAITKLGMYAYLKFFADMIASVTNENSKENAGSKNFGSPKGIPNAPTIHIATSNKTTDFWILFILI